MCIYINICVCVRERERERERERGVCVRERERESQTTIMCDSFILMDPNKMKSLLVSVVRTLTVMSKILFCLVYLCVPLSLTHL